MESKKIVCVLTISANCHMHVCICSQDYRKRQRYTAALIRSFVLAPSQAKHSTVIHLVWFLSPSLFLAVRFGFNIYKFLLLVMLLTLLLPSTICTTTQLHTHAGLCVSVCTRVYMCVVATCLLPFSSMRFADDKTLCKRCKQANEPAGQNEIDVNIWAVMHAVTCTAYLLHV